MPPALARRNSSNTSPARRRSTAPAEPVGEQLHHLQVVEDTVAAAAGPGGAGGRGPRDWSWCPPPRPTGPWAGPRRRAQRSRSGRCRRRRAGPARPAGRPPGSHRARTPRHWRPAPAGPSRPRRCPSDRASRTPTAGPGKLGRIDPPHRRHVGPVGRVGQLAVPGQLIGLLPVLPTALAVALAGDRAVAGERPPGRPRASARLMKAWAVSVPLLCCSAPRAVRIIALSRRREGLRWCAQVGTGTR